MSDDWLTLWKASRAQKKLHEQHRPNGGSAGWPATGAPHYWKIVTGLQGGKLSTAKKIQFLQAPVASFVCELFSVFRQLRSEFWLVFFSLYSFHCLWNFYSVTCIHPLQHTFLSIIPSGGFTDILHRPTSSPKTYWRCVRVKITSR